MCDMEEIKRQYYNNRNIQKETHCINGKLHRLNGPAIIWYNKDGDIGIEEYYKNDQLHREDGPAIIWYNTDGSIQKEFYYIEDKEYNDMFLYSVAVGCLK